jgi:hypothetical protein
MTTFIKVKAGASQEEIFLREDHVSSVLFGKFPASWSTSGDGAKVTMLSHQEVIVMNPDSLACLQKFVGKIAESDEF